MDKVYVKPNEIVRLELPHSEVCMHMQIAGKVMDVKLVQSAPGAWPMAQLLTPEGLEYSAAITVGEAGFYYENDTKQFYCYPRERMIYTMANIAQFAEAKQRGETLEVDEELFYYFLEVLPPYRVSYRTHLKSGRIQQVDFGFAEGAEPVTAFWR